MYNKEASIMSQVAVKAAAELFGGQMNTEGAVAAAGQFYQFMVSVSGDPTQGPAPVAAQPVQAQPIPTGPQPTNMAQATQQVVQQLGGQVVSGFQNDEERWQHLFANPDAWYDNRNDSRASINGGNGPDFRLKADKEQALWLRSKYGPAPAWVYEKLGYQFPGQVPQNGQQVAQGPVPF